MVKFSEAPRGNVQMSDAVIAMSKPPTRISGRRRPQRLLKLSEK